MVSRILVHHRVIQTSGGCRVELSGSATPVIKYEFYLNRFNTRHNLSFGRPRSDTCPTCDTFEIRIKEEQDGEAKAKVKSERQLHHCKAE